MFATILLSLFSLMGFASHYMGGEITWECQGNGQYIFKLAIYRDCNGQDITDPLLKIEVWGHPTVSEIDCFFDSSIDLSPTCTEVIGGPIELNCGSGSSGGNGAGAIEKFIYISQPITLGGVPPAGGWAFTHDSFSRNYDLDNIANPSTTGITIWARMYPHNNLDGNPCYDSSPQFGQNPLTITCSGSDFTIEQNNYDPDGDSLVFEWGIPLDHFLSGSFDPPNNPVPVAYNSGFSFDNPTPDQAFSPSNIPASLNPNTGSVNFTSNTIGNYAINVLIKAYRDGQLISETSREIQVIVIACPNYNNTAPIITPPFNGNTSFDTTVNAGDLVTFDFISSDPELLQDGTNQSNILTPSGNQFGANFTNAATGCDAPPCASLSSPIPIIGTQGLNTEFNWQTDCNHVINADGTPALSKDYTFVFKVSDDYCTIPLTSFATVTITVLGEEAMDACELTCLQVDQNGDVTINWTQPNDPTGSFVQYEVYSIQDGLIGTVTDYNTLSFTHAGAAADVSSKDYFVSTVSGCNGTIKANSDTLKSIHLDLTNPANGTAILSWNQPGSWQNEWSSHFKIYMEYPAGTWNMIDSIPFDETQFLDTITICSAFLNYQIRLEHASGCEFTSNIEGDDFEDLIKPEIPVITAVSVDTSTNDVNISWNINPSEDTYGYIIYIQDQFGLWITLDTLWGITSTDYTHIGAGADQGILHYSVAAFDSCFVAGINPPIYQTSAKSPKHFTMLLEAELEICEIAAVLDWTEYDSWVGGVQQYEVYYTNASNGITEFANLTTPVQSTYTHTGLTRGETYCYYIRAVSNDGAESWSNRYCLYIDEPQPPGTNYLSTATVTEGNDVEVRILTEPASGIGALVLQRSDDPAGPFEDIGSVIPNSNQEQIFDYTADVKERSYYYKIAVEDTCGDISIESNIAKTILLESQVNNDELVVTLAWNSYEGFDGSILRYHIYRGVDGLFDNTNPIATLPPNIRAYEDDVSGFLNSQGSICYRVEAVESVNSYGIAETAFSNVECADLQPLIFVPSGFIKNGVNNIFKPVISLFDFSSYEMVIYNRWGNQIFQSNDYNQGWDGTLKNGEVAPETSYVYVIRFQDAAGVTHTSRGSITFLIGAE